MSVRDWFKNDEQKSQERAAKERAIWDQRESAQREQEFMTIHGVRDLNLARDQISALDTHNARQNRQRDQKVSDDTRAYASNRDRVFMSEHARGHHDQRGETRRTSDVQSGINDRQMIRGALADLDRPDKTFDQMESAPKQSVQQGQAAAQVHQRAKGKAQ